MSTLSEALREHKTIGGFLWPCCARMSHLKTCYTAREKGEMKWLGRSCWLGLIHFDCKLPIGLGSPIWFAVHQKLFLIVNNYKICFWCFWLWPIVVHSCSLQTWLVCFCLLPTINNIPWTILHVVKRWLLLWNLQVWQIIQLVTRHRSVQQQLIVISPIKSCGLIIQGLQHLCMVENDAYSPEKVVVL